MPRAKAGQLTAFIIVGIVILAIAAVVLYVRTLTRPAPPPTPPELAPLKAFVEACLEQAGKAALLEVGQRGGYVEPVPLPSFNYFGNDTATWFYLDRAFVPEKKAIEFELGVGALRQLPSCIADFESFRAEGFEIETGNATPNITIGEREVFFKLNWPIKLRRGAVEATLDEFGATIPVRLGIIYGIIKDYILEQQALPSMLCVSCLVKLAVKNDIVFDSVYEGDLILLKLVDDVVKVGGRPYEFAFGVRLGALPPEIVPTPAVTLQEIADQEIVAESELKIELKATGTAPTFKEYSPICVIEQTRFLVCRPTNENVGTNLVLVEVTAKEGSDTELFALEVKKLNHPPVVTKPAEGEIITSTAGAPLTYQIDADGDLLTYSLLTGPAITITPTGQLIWIPTEAGVYAVVIEISDGELAVTRKFTINVQVS